MKITNEAKIGAMVAAVIVMLAYITFQAGDFNFSRGGLSRESSFY